MKVHMTVLNGMNLEFEATSIKDLFRKSSEVNEVLAEPCCGMCKSESIVPRYRKVDTYEYFELLCKSCGATLKFGQTKADQKLFPHRKDDEGNWDNQHKGWKKYQKQEGKPQKQASLPAEDEVPF